MLREYRALVDKVTAFTDATAGRRRADLHCRSGCASCCHTWLTVSMVEAAALREALARLSLDERARVRARGVDELLRQGRGDTPPRCAMLDEHDRCAVYDGRPLVCRTQGHALRYPPGFIPLTAIARKSANGEETWCPLNYHASAPNREDVLDAERVDQILAVVSARYLLAQAPDACAVSALDSAQRVGLSELAVEEDVRNDQTARGARFEATDR